MTQEHRDTSTTGVECKEECVNMYGYFLVELYSHGWTDNAKASILFDKHAFRFWPCVTNMELGWCLYVRVFVCLGEKSVDDKGKRRGNCSFIYSIEFLCTQWQHNSIIKHMIMIWGSAFHHNACTPTSAVEGGAFANLWGGNTV